MLDKLFIYLPLINKRILFLTANQKQYTQLENKFFDKVTRSQLVTFFF